MVRLRGKLAAVVSKLADTEKLLAIADPDGFFKAGSAAAKAATLRATQALAAERLRAEAAEKRRKIREVCGDPWVALSERGRLLVARKWNSSSTYQRPSRHVHNCSLCSAEVLQCFQEAARKVAESSDFVPEVEEDEPSSAGGSGAAQQPAAAPAANIHRLEAETNVTGGLQVWPRAAASAGDAAEPAEPEPTPRDSLDPAPAAAHTTPATAAQPGVAPPAAAGTPAGPTPDARRPTPGVPVGKAPGGLQSRQDVAAQRRRPPGSANGARTVNGSGGMSAADAQAAVAANLARLSNARKAAAEEGPGEVTTWQLCSCLTVWHACCFARCDLRLRWQAEDGSEGVIWQPPEGQKGDGRTALNEALGY